MNNEDIKELFAEWGLWSLIDDISDDGDGHGDNLQLTKEGLEAKRMIDQLLEDEYQRGVKEGIKMKMTKDQEKLEKGVK